MIPRKSPREIATMREAGLVVAAAIAAVRAVVEPGITTRELDAVAEKTIRDAGATPSFLGYHGFPATLCLSVNDEVVHGIPGDRVVADGDVLSIDCGAVVGGYHGDAAVTVCVGDVPAEVRAMVEVCREALERGLGAVRDGGRLSDIGAAVESYARPFGYGVVDEYTGHGIGRALHEAPAVPNVAPKGPGRGPRLQPGVVLAIEPMVTLGTSLVRVLEDDWTVVTQDGLPAAHFEDTIALTDDGPVVLTRP
ncbi:MAG TPA: type I methionyl aminopeptidase [Mycobacteriales bacterium]|nr:type I methionyl aminopeptidase [Mycobacteriales bacterium]